MNNINYEEQLNSATNENLEPKVESDIIKRIRQRSQLYMSFEQGFGKEIAKNLSTDVVDAIESAKVFLDNFKRRHS